MNEYIVFFLDFLNRFPFIIVFLPIVFGGDAAIITLAFLSQQGPIKLSYVVIFGFIGAILADMLWYSLTTLKILDRFKRWKKIKGSYQNLELGIEKASHRKDFFILLIAKFVVGTRVVTILYLGLKKINFYRFFVYSIITNFIWITCLIILGVLAGKGFAVLGIFETVQWVIAGITGIIVLWYFVERYLTKKFLEKTN